MDIIYSVDHDYTGLYNNKFIEILHQYNTLLIPIDLINTEDLNNITVFNTQRKKYVLQLIKNANTIRINTTEYNIYYIVPSIPYGIYYYNDHLINNNLNEYGIKMINGFFILPNNFLYLFKNINYANLLYNSSTYLTKINHAYNKHNIYIGNTTTTLLDIIDIENLDILIKINNDYKSQIYIQPICHKNFPLGHIDIQIKDALGVYDYILKINNKHINISHRLYVDYLRQGIYNISILNRQGLPVRINKVNGEIIDQDGFDITIRHILPQDNYKISSNIKQYLQNKR